MQYLLCISSDSGNDSAGRRNDISGIYAEDSQDLQEWAFFYFDNCSGIGDDSAGTC